MGAGEKMNNSECEKRPEQTSFGFFSYPGGKRNYCVVDGVRYECGSLKEAIDIWNRVSIEKGEKK